MVNRMRCIASLAGTLLPFPVLLAACGGDDAGLTRAEVEEIVREAIASIPSEATPAEYTQHVVRNAIARYETQGLDATLAHYNSPQSLEASSV